MGGMDKEELLRHFCLEIQCAQVTGWFRENGYVRPDDFDARLALADRLRQLGETRRDASDLLSASMHELSAIHCLDFSRVQQVLQSEEQKSLSCRMTAQVLGDLSAIFALTGDLYNSARAADVGMRRLEGVTDDEFRKTTLSVKLLTCRGIANQAQQNFKQALADFREAAVLDPESSVVRGALKDCEDLAGPDGRQARLDQLRPMAKHCCAFVRDTFSQMPVEITMVLVIGLLFQYLKPMIWSYVLGSG